MGKASFVLSSKDRTKKGINSAKRNISGLGKAAQSCNRMMKIAFAGLGLRAISGALSSVNQKFEEQSDVNVKLAQVLKATGSAIPYDEMKKMADNMSRMTAIPDEVINQSQAVMATFKAIGEKTFPRAQMAAMDMAKTLKTDLQGATIQVSKALNDFSGYTALKRAGVSFSEEQENMIKKFREMNDLASYQELILKELEGEFGGVAEAMGQTDVGAIATAANTLGDIQEKIGGIFTGIKADLARSFQPVFDKINTWMGENSGKIKNLFKNIPAAANSTFSLVKSLLGSIFTIEFWQGFGSVAWKFFKSSAVLCLDFIWESIKAIGLTIWEPLKYGFDSIVHGIKSMFANVINFFIDKINFLSAKAHEIGQVLSHPLDKSQRTEFSGGIERVSGPGEAPKNNIAQNISGIWAKTLKKYAEQTGEAGKLIAEAFSDSVAVGADLFHDEFISFSSDINQIMGEGLSVNVAGNTDNDGFEDSVGGEPADLSFLENLVSGFAEPLTASFNDAIGGMTEGMGAAGNVLSGFVSALFNALMSVESIAAILNPFKVVLDGMFQILRPVINDILAPIIGFLNIFGQMLGKIILPILKILSPVMEIVTKAFVFIYNYALRPFGNMVIWLVCLINNFIATIVNAVITALNFIPFVNIKWRMNKMNYGDYKLEKISEQDINQAGAEYSGYELSGTSGESSTSTGGSTGSSAAYSAKGDIIVNVNYSVGISAFDDRDIALKIRDQIEDAEAMGF